MIKAVLLDGHLKSTLAAVRSLGMHNIEVMVGSDRKTGMSLHSRYSTQKYIYPHPLTHTKSFLEALVTLGQTFDNKPLLYTFSDQTSALVSRHRIELAQYFRLLLPEAENFEIAFDKSRTVRIAMELGVAVPKTFFPQNEVELDTISLSWPVVVKPRSNYAWVGDEGRSSRVQFAFSSRELKELFSRIYQEMGTPPIIQEYVHHGRELGMEGVFKDGIAVSSCAHERLRSLDPTGGASVYKKTIEPSLLMRESTQKIMKRLEWQGPAMIEYVQAPDGQLYLLEINGRFWGSLPLAVFAGVDFPYHVFQVSHKETVREMQKKSPVFSRYLLGDISWLMKVLFKQSPMRSLSYSGRMEAIMAFLKAFHPRIHEDVWSWRDPLPFLWDSIDKAT